MHLRGDNNPENDQNIMNIDTEPTIQFLAKHLHTDRNCRLKQFRIFCQDQMSLAFSSKLKSRRKEQSHILPKTLAKNTFPQFQSNIWLT